MWLILILNELCVISCELILMHVREKKSDQPAVFAPACHHSHDVTSYFNSSGLRYSTF